MKGTVLELFARRVEVDGGATALTHEGGQVTYQELDRRSRRVARALRSAGVERGDRVGVALERGAPLVAAILGVLRAGAAYVPLDPANPPERLRLIVEDAGPTVVLTDPALEGRLPGTAPVLTVDGADEPGHDGNGSEGPGPSPDDLAYVIYTSGSTGRPKGVMVTHRNVRLLMDATEPLFDFRESDVWTLFHSYGFDFSVWELWGALAHGGRLVIPTAETVRAPDAFYALLEREGVTVLCQTPSAFSSLLDLEERSGTRPLRLRYVIFGGEELDPGRLAGWFRRRGADGPTVVNMFGTTETTVHTTFRAITAVDCAGPLRSPIGVALPHLEIDLVDASGAVVDPGEPGEMVVRGGGVAVGYLGRPEETEARFGRTEEGVRSYRTGDLAVRLPDGSLDYRGRADDQVQVRGFRVEPGEIEAALRRSDAVADAVVVHVPTPAPGRLVAYLVPVGPARPAWGTEQEIRRDLAGRVPAYMLPSDYVYLDRLPLNPNGKVDRDALPDPPARKPAVDGGEEAPEALPGDGTLARLRAIWKEYLSVEELGPETDFFEAGGHSLLAVEVMVRTEEEFGVDLPLGTLFEVTTLAEVARRVEELTEGTEELVL